MKKGQKCKRGDPYWVCEEGLVCSGSKDNPRCVMPMKKGEACRKGDPYWICEEGLKCVGPKGNQRCERPMKKGENCRKKDPFWICEEGLKCEAGVCTEENWAWVRLFVVLCKRWEVYFVDKFWGGFKVDYAIWFCFATAVNLRNCCDGCTHRDSDWNFGDKCVL